MDNIHSSLRKTLEELRKGNFVLIHDSDKRENETDMVMAAEFVRAEDIAQMRKDGGGLICIAVERGIAEKLELPFMSDILSLGSDEFPVLRYLKADDIPYDKKSSFSISINYRGTFTGITDTDRALTIREFGKFCRKFCRRLNNLNNKDNLQREFGSKFRTPGHVNLLISSGLENREGHTELSTALMKIAGLTPVAAICEMMDSKTHKALSRKDTILYAKKNNLKFLETNEIKDAYRKLQKVSS